METKQNSWKLIRTGGVELRAALNVVLAVEHAWSRTGGFDPVEYWRTVQLTEYNWWFHRYVIPVKPGEKTRTPGCYPGEIQPAEGAVFF